MRSNLLTLCLLILLTGCNTGTVKNSGPVVGAVDVLPNQMVYVHAALEHGEIIDIRKVADGGSLSFKLSKTSSGMMLSAKNQLDVIVKYDIYMIDFAGKKHYTSSCPVMPGLSVFESWPHKIPAMSIENFRILPEDGDLACQ